MSNTSNNSTDKDSDKVSGKPPNKSAQREAGEQRFWRALQKDSPASSTDPASVDDTRPASKPQLIDLTADLSELSDEERETRRRALRSMLAASEARQQQVLRTRLPALTPGLTVKVRSGHFKERTGTVVDADYIHSRVLLSFTDEADSHWVEFARIAPLAEDVESADIDAENDAAEGTSELRNTAGANIPLDKDDAGK